MSEVETSNPNPYAYYATFLQTKTNLLYCYNKIYTWWLKQNHNVQPWYQILK